MLRQWLRLSEQESDLKKQVKTAEAELDAAAFSKYPALDDQQVEAITVDRKWLAAVSAAVDDEVGSASESATQRVGELAERYETTGLTAANRVSELGRAVDSHLMKMGFSWN